MNIELKPIDSIKPYDRNPRKNDMAVNAVANSITSFGFRARATPADVRRLVEARGRGPAARRRADPPREHDPPYNVKVEPRSNNAIAAGLSSFTMAQRKDASATDQQSADLHRYPEKAKPTHKKLRAKDRPLANDFVSDEEFDRLLAAWFGNIARVLIPGGGFYIWGGYANCANYPPVLKAWSCTSRRRSSGTRSTRS
jgi:hypothetical protein